MLDRDLRFDKKNNGMDNNGKFYCQTQTIFIYLH